MIHDDHPIHSVLIRELRCSLSDLPVRERPPLEVIINRGHMYRRRQVGGLAILCAIAVTVGGALVLGLSGIHNAASRSTTSKQGVRAKTGTIRTAAFTLVSYSNGTDKLILTNSQVFNSRELRRALAKDGIPALVKSDAYCSSDPAPPDPNSIGVLSTRLPSPGGFLPGKGLRKVPGPRRPQPKLGRLINHTVTVINRTKMPPGTELAFDYAPGEHLLSVNLVYTKSHTCKSGQPPAQ